MLFTDIVVYLLQQTHQLNEKKNDTVVWYDKNDTTTWTVVIFGKINNFHTEI